MPTLVKHWKRVIDEAMLSVDVARDDRFDMGYARCGNLRPDVSFGSGIASYSL